MDNETKQALIDIENSIVRLEKTQIELWRKERPLRERMEVLKARVLLEIAQAKDANGRKPLYPNQQVRDAALTLYLHEMLTTRRYATS